MNREAIAITLKAAERSIVTLLAVAAGFVIGRVLIEVIW